MPQAWEGAARLLTRVARAARELGLSWFFTTMPERSSKHPAK